jgi:hypothetical protein
MIWVTMIAIVATATKFVELQFLTEMPSLLPSLSSLDFLFVW